MKRIIATILAFAIILCPISIAPFNSIVVASSDTNDTIAVNSDNESYENDWYYYVDKSGQNYIYKDTDKMDSKTYLTDYPVDQIAVRDSQLFYSINNELWDISVDDLSTERLFIADNNIDRFAVTTSNVYYLSTGDIFSYCIASGEHTEIEINDEIIHFWMDNSNTISYMLDSDYIYSLDLSTRKVTKIENISSSFDDEIPVFSDSIYLEEEYGGGLSLSSLQSKFPAGKYWNHAGNPGTSSSVNNQNGYTSTPCPQHGTVGTSSQTCNGFAPNGTQLSWQCMGYAEKCGYDVTGYNPRNNANGWTTTSSSSALDSLKAGDIVRYKNNGHSIYVTAVSGDTVTYTDCNSDGHCIIRWGATISKSTLRATFTNVRVAPGSPTPITCSCSSSYAGNYVCTTSSLNLTIRSGHGSSYGAVGAIPPGAIVYVSKASGTSSSDWAHVEYNGVSGYASMEYLRSTASTSYWLDVNCEVDGTYCGELDGFGTVDVYVNGTCVGSDVDDYYTQHSSGSTYTVNDITAAPGYRYVGASSYSGTINGDVSIILRFESTREYRTISGPNTNFKMTISTGGTEFYCAFTPTASREHVIYSVNTDGNDPVVTLYDSNGDVLASNDDKGSNGDRNFRLAYNLVAGHQYYYGIRHYSSSSTGEIKVKLGYTYTLQYNANGGTGAPSSIKVDYGQGFTISNTTPTRTGYTFVGWAGSSSATSAELYPGDERQVTSGATDTTIILYAVWARSVYTITYNANGGSGAPSSHTITAGSSGTVSSTIPTRTGYTFLGWSTSSSASSATYKPGDSISPSGNTTFYAVWKQTTLSSNTSISVPITYGGQMYYYKFVPSTTAEYVIYSTGDADTKVYLYNSSGSQIDVDDDDGEGYNFRLAYNLNSGTTYYFGIEYYSGSKTGTIPVKFGRTYTVSYNANGGSGTPSSQTKDYGATLTLTSDKPTRSGYTFLGWSTSNSATSVTYSAGGSYTSNSSATLYAVWSHSGYTITYDSSLTGGTGYPASQTKAKGSSITLSSVTPTKSITVTFDPNGGSVSPTSKPYSFEFDSWFDQWADTYYPGETYSTDANLTLYAGWKSATGTFPTPTRSGYQFEGWYTAASGGVKFSSPANLSTDSKVTTRTLYAHWTQISEYTISYNANSGSGTPVSHTVTAGSSTTVSTTKPTRNGYTFLGWSTSSSASSATYIPGASITPSGNITLYAVWKQTTISANSSVNVPITYGGQMYYYKFVPSTTAQYVIYSTGSADTKVYLYNSSGTELSLNDDISSSDRNFRLVYDLTSGTTYYFGIRYYSSSTTGTIPVKFGRTYTISYNSNGGSGAPSSQIKDYGKNLILSSTEPTRSGRTFLGWSTSDSATSATYTKGGTYSSDANATLYAVWSSAATYTVTFNPNGGSVSPTSKTVTSGGTYGTLPTPTKSGYTFDGWYTSSSGGTKVTSSTSVSITSAQTLYAHWSPVPTSSDLTVTVGSVSGPVGSTVTVPIKISNNPGIIALGFKVSYNTSYLQLTNATATSLIGNGTTFSESYNSPYTMIWNNLVQNDYTGNGTIANLTFKILSKPSNGEIPITIATTGVDDTFNSDFDNVATSYVNGKVTVNARLAGDVNSDGSVNQKDVAYLQRYLAGWNAYQSPSLDNANVNGDSSVNQKDVAYLQRHLAGWSGYSLI